MLDETILKKHIGNPLCSQKFNEELGGQNIPKVDS